MNNYLITEFNLFGFGKKNDEPDYEILKKNRHPVNHGFYTESISRKQFFQMYEENCNQIDLKKPLFIRRGIKRNENLLFCDTVLHTSQYYSDDYSLLYKIMYKSINWMGYPVKDRSLDVAYMKGYNSWGSYGTDYMLVPFNNSRFVLKDNGNIPSAFNNCAAIVGAWQSITTSVNKSKNYFIEHYEECMQELENYHGPRNHYYLDQIRRDMARYHTSFIDTFENYFDPAKDGYHLEDYEGAREVVNSKNVSNLLGWTDARVLMVNAKYWNDVLRHKI